MDLPSKGFECKQQMPGEMLSGHFYFEKKDFPATGIHLHVLPPFSFRTTATYLNFSSKLRRGTSQWADGFLVRNAGTFQGFERVIPAFHTDEPGQF